MKTLTKCDLCGSENLKFLYNTLDYNRGFKGTFCLWGCKNCGLIFLNPQLSPKELEKYYTPDYYKRIEKNPNRVRNVTEGFSGKLLSVFIKHPIVFKVFLFPLSSFIRGVKIIPYGKYLDAGCGKGQFLYEMKQLNPKGEYFGVEPGDFDKEDIKKRGLKIFKETLVDACFPNNYFDIITLNQVFEHVHNPSQTIKELKRILKPGGTLIIAVPNCNSLGYKLFRKYWYHLDAPRHLFDYSDKTLKKYAEKFHFNIVKIRHGFQWEQIGLIVSFIHYSGKFARKNDLWGTVYKKIQKRNIFLWAAFVCLSIILIPLTILLNILKFGEGIEIWLKK